MEFRKGWVGGQETKAKCVANPGNRRNKMTVQTVPLPEGL